ncbi:MAG: hypothetical protein V1799_03655 [bacterium]
MKLFENMAEYQAFKRKYEMMGQLEEERILKAAEDPASLQEFLIFMDEALAFPIDESIHQKVRDIELQSTIDRQRLLNRLPDIKE